jgi:hypothetical protein
MKITIKDKEYSGTDFLRCTKQLNELGFSNEEMEAAIDTAGTTESQLTERKHYSKDSNIVNYYTNKGDDPQRGIYVGMEYGYIKRVVTVRDREYENTSREIAHAVVQPNQYQGLYQGKIIHVLLASRLPWFDSFEWSIYEMHGYDKQVYEIYMKTENGSLYAPVKALLACDAEAIKKRNIDYFAQYYRWDYNLNHQKGESVEDFNARCEGMREKAVKNFGSKEAKQLFEVMK